MFVRGMIAALSGLVLLTSAPAFAASDVSNSSGLQNQQIVSIIAPIASSQTASLISGAIGGALGGGFGGGFGGSLISTNLGQTGQAAGNTPDKYDLWLRGAYSATEYDKVGATFDGGIATLMGGGSVFFSDNLLAGLALGYERLDLKTGTLAGTGKMEADGFTVAPYIGFKLTPRWTLDGSVGYSSLSYDTSRTNNTITGSFDARRWFGAVGLTGTYALGQGLFIAPQIGTMYLNEKQDGYVESNGTAVGETTIEVGRAHAGAKLSYPMGMIAPYLRARAEYDYVHEGAVAIGNGTTTGNERLGGQIGLGLDIMSAGPMSGMVEASYDSLGRSDLNTWTLVAKFRYQF